ncbi:hypothetical protein BX616_009106 [Lobosporangium transversale]|nr:hypothetical protein BX616_009106 [Lobosporangium transversale]
MATSTVAGSNGKSRMTSHRRGKAKSSPTSNGNGNGNGLIQHDETQETSHSDFSNGSSRASSPIPTQHAHISEFEQTYVNEDHMQQFRQALEDSVRSETSAELISAVTDFMPVQQASSKRARSRKTPRIYKGYSYTLLRIPLMVMRGRRNQLRKELRNATTYSDWKAAAQRLDTYMKKDDWKNDPNFGYYDYHLLSRVNRNLRLAREANRVDELKDHLQGVVKSNFGGVENARLYSQTYHGTKKPIEEYVREVTTSLQAVVESKQLTDEEKRVFFKSIHKNYGRTALCLSGGAGFGYYHLGVVRALLQAGVLPTVITGTSAGALMAALVCCHTDEELNEVLVPELAHKFTACADSIFTWLPRLIRKGARFDAEDWARKAQWVTKGGLTFLEAYERTGRILNVSVVPYDPHSPPKLLNYLTAPDCVVWSAVIASAAIPGILNPVVLMRKRPDGKLVPFSYGGRGFKDGSLRADIPLQALHTHFNVNYTIVSQVNPHIHLFFYGSRGSIGRPVSHLYGEGWRGGFLAASIEQFLKLDLSKWLKVLRDLELLPKVMNQDWSWIWLQKFDGHVTILQMIAECRSEIKKKLDRKVHGRNLRDAGNSRVLSEDSENTICSRMNSFRDAYSQAGDAYPEGKTRKRRVASWPGLRYALGQESLGDYDALKAKFAHRDEDENVNDIESYVEEKDYEDEDEGMGMEERYD